MPETPFVRPRATMPGRRASVPTATYRVDGWIEAFRRPLGAPLPELERAHAAAATERYLAEIAEVLRLEAEQARHAQRRSQWLQTQAIVLTWISLAVSLFSVAVAVIEAI